MLFRSSERHGFETIYQVVGNTIDRAFVKFWELSESAQIKLERLALYAELVWLIVNDDGGKVRLPSNGADSRKLRSLDVDCAYDRVWIFALFVKGAGKDFEDRRIGIVIILLGL